MAKSIDPQKIFEILKKLPDETKEVLFSEKTADDVERICKKYGVGMDKIIEIARCTGQVIMGILPLEKFPEMLEKETGLGKNTANNVAQEIGLYVFSGLALGQKAPAKTEGAASVEEEPQKPPAGPDIYREQIG